MSSSLEGKVVVIVGASSGIGKGAAEAIAEEHPRAIVLAARRENLLTDLANSLISEYKVKASAIKTDVTIPGDLDILLKETISQYGSADIVINAAGLIQKIGEELENMTDERIDAIIKTNFNSVAYLAKRLVPIFKKQKGGIYVAISSEAADIPYSDYEPYCGTKRGVNGFMDSLNSTFEILRNKGIEMYSFALGPGLIDTEEARANFPDTSESVWKRAPNGKKFSKDYIIPYITDPKTQLEKHGPTRTIKTVNAEDSQ